MHITSDPGSVTRLSLCAFCRVTQIVTYIHTKSPKTQIVLLGILPRGGLYWEKDQAWIWPQPLHSSHRCSQCWLLCERTFDHSLHEPLVPIP